MLKDLILLTIVANHREYLSDDTVQKNCTKIEALQAESVRRGSKNEINMTVPVIAMKI